MKILKQYIYRIYIRGKNKLKKANLFIPQGNTVLVFIRWTFSIFALSRENRSSITKTESNPFSIENFHVQSFYPLKTPAVMCIELFFRDSFLLHHLLKNFYDVKCARTPPPTSPNSFTIQDAADYPVLRCTLKDIYYCPIENIKGLTDKGQFQYLTKLKRPQVGNYQYTTQFLSLR